MAVFWTEEYQRHFQHYFNKPFDIQVYRGPDGASLKLATYDWVGQSLRIFSSRGLVHTDLPEHERLGLKNFRVYASMGLAEKLYQDGEEVFGEVVLYSDVTDIEVPKLFINALFFILQKEIPLGSPFAIAFGDDHHPLARRYGKTAFYFSRPSDDDEAFSEVQRGEMVGRILQAYFITTAEDKFLDEHGADAFEAIFWKQFDTRLSEEERIELLVDKTRSSEVLARINELAKNAIMALSVRRPSCV